MKRQTYMYIFYICTKDRIMRRPPVTYDGRSSFMACRYEGLMTNYGVCGGCLGFNEPRPFTHLLYKVLRPPTCGHKTYRTARLIYWAIQAP